MLNTYTPHAQEDATYRLLSYSRAIAPVDLIAFLRSAPLQSQRFYWESRNEPVAFAGYGVTVALSAHGADRISQINRQARDVFASAIVEGHESGITPRLFGGFAFHPDYTPEGIWSAFPAAYFVLPRYIVTRIEDRAWLTVNACVPFGDEALLGDELAWMIQRLARLSPVEGCRLADDNCLAQLDHPLRPEQWRDQVERATGRIRAGDLDKVVLSRTREARFSAPVDPLRALDYLQTHYTDCFRFLIEPQAGHAFFGATPELLASVDRNHLETAALAGSIRRGADDAEDRALAQSLLSNPKERHEHEVVVAMLREQLQPIVADLTSPETPGIYRLSNIQHLYTPFSGTLKPGENVLSVIERLHPTPALGGYPQRLALEAIAQTELISRGWYAAPVGWFDHQGNGAFAVAIRSAVSAGNTARLYAGAGIVADSQPDREWDETSLKFRPMMHALGISEAS